MSSCHRRWRRTRPAAFLALALAAATGTSGAPVTRCGNGLYLKAASVNASADELLGLARSAGVRYLYFYGPGAEPFDSPLAAFAEKARATLANPALVVMLGRRLCTAGNDSHCLDLGSAIAREQLATRAAAAWHAGFDGVQLDLEPVADGDEALIALLEHLRALKPPSKLLSIAGDSLVLDAAARQAVRQTPQGAQPLPGWSAGYYRRVMASVDQVTVMNYDTAIRDGAQYRAFTVWQTKQLLALRPASLDLQIGLPTAVPGRRGLFDRAAENLANGLAGVRDAFGGPGGCPPHTGVTLFTADGMTSASWQDVTRDFGTGSPP